MNGKITKERLLEILKTGLPGEAAQQKMAPDVRISSQFREDCRDAAVLLLFYPYKEETKIVFMKRNEYDGPHSGQISFPGGMREPTDADLQATALRETEEETGVQATEIEILGTLTPLHVPVSNFCVHPFVGWMDGEPDFRPDETEVQYLVCPALEEVIDRKNRKKGVFHRGTEKITTPYFDIHGEMIWGATAMILSEFMVVAGY